MTITDPGADKLNEKVKQAIEDILVEIAPEKEEDIGRPSSDEEFEAEQKRHLKD